MTPWWIHIYVSRGRSRNRKRGGHGIIIGGLEASPRYLYWYEASIRSAAVASTYNYDFILAVVNMLHEAKSVLLGIPGGGGGGCTLSQPIPVCHCISKK